MPFDYKAIASKKVAGVPVLYLAGAAVTILAVVAWKMKPAPDADEASTGDTEPLAEDVEAADYSGLASGGTVTVVQPPAATAETIEETNDDWERAAVSYLIGDKKATATEAQAAISKYLDGADLTFAEGQLKNDAVAKLGLPPERLSNVGVVGTAPAQKQFSLFPGTHVVKNANDNTAAKLASLYYGVGDANHANLIVSQNASLGPVGTTYNVGTSVKIPKWENPRYATSNKTENWPGEVAKKNGISYTQLLALNPGMTLGTELKPGTVLRVG